MQLLSPIFKQHMYSTTKLGDALLRILFSLHTFISTQSLGLIICTLKNTNGTEASEDPSKCATAQIRHVQNHQRKPTPSSTNTFLNHLVFRHSTQRHFAGKEGNISPWFVQQFIMYFSPSLWMISTSQLVSFVVLFFSLLASPELECLPDSLCWKGPLTAYFQQIFLS